MTPLLPKGAFSGLVVWITGASSGIGKEMALMLAERGARLVLSSRRKESLEKVAEECRKHNSDAQVKIVVLDLNDMPSLASKAKEAAESFGEAVDVMINNGGVGTRAVARESSVGVDEYLIQVDYLSHVCLTKSVLPGMEQKSDARIINMGSIASKMGVPARTAYCGAKHALVGFMEALRGECILHGHDHIHVLNAIVGSTDTPLPLAAVTDVSGSTIETFGEADKNISNGMSVEFVTERILSVSYHKTVDECWLAKGKELVALYIRQYLPQTALKLLLRSLGKQYTVTKGKKKDD